MTPEFDEITRLNNELLNAQRELQRKNRTLESLNAEKNEAIGVVAHDLRNPIGLIKMCSDLLMRDPDGLNADQRELLVMIRDASASMARMVNDVLDLSAIESGTLRLNRQPAELASCVTRNIERNRILARASNVAIDVQSPREPLPVEVDLPKFDQVLNNLLANAVSFSTTGGRVEVRVFQDRDDAIVAVRDHGPGIPAGEAEQLFRPFVRGRPTQRSGQSTGLGLAIVKRIVEGHGGRIDVQSEPGKGATFSVRLPRVLPVQHVQHALSPQLT